MIQQLPDNESDEEEALNEEEDAEEEQELQRVQAELAALRHENAALRANLPGLLSHTHSYSSLPKDGAGGANKSPSRSQATSPKDPSRSQAGHTDHLEGLVQAMDEFVKDLTPKLEAAEAFNK